MYRRPPFIVFVAFTTLLAPTPSHQQFWMIQHVELVSEAIYDRKLSTELLLGPLPKMLLLMIIKEQLMKFNDIER